MQNKIKEIVSKITKGQFFKVEYKSQPTQLAKGHKEDILIKYTKVVARNVRYGNMKAHKDTEIQDLKGVEWVEGTNGLILKKIGSEQYYLRLNTVPNQKPTTKWVLNGKEVSKEYLQENGILQPSYWNRKTTTDTYNVKLENVLSIG